MKLKFIRESGEESFYDTDTCIWHIPAGGIGVAQSTTRVVRNPTYQFGEDCNIAIDKAVMSEVGDTTLVEGSIPYFRKIVKII